jgi:subtilisin family serine protease
MDLRSDFSSYGNHIDLSAPGSEILSTYWVSPNQHSYAYLWGTSMATPHVAGVLGLMRSIAPSKSIEELRSILRASADDLGSPGWDILYGAGRLNALVALEATSGMISDVAIARQTINAINKPITFSAKINTTFASYPITFTWEADDQEKMIFTAGLTNTATYTWSTPGMKVVRVTVANESSSRTSTKTFYVGESIHFPTIKNKK